MNTSVDSQPLLTVLVTCYNEQDFILGSLEAVVGAVRQVGVAYEILVIDDASRDSSVERVRHYLHDHPELPISLHVNEINQGWATNFITGARLGCGKYYHLVCGDDSMPEKYLVAAYRLIGKADIIIPYQNQREVAGKSRARKVISRAFTGLVSLLSGYRLRYYNGMAIYRREDVVQLHSDSRGFDFQADMLTQYLDRGATYIQVYSCSIDKKGSGSTSLTWRNLLSVGRTLMKIAIRRLRRPFAWRRWPKPVEIVLPNAQNPA